MKKFYCLHVVCYSEDREMFFAVINNTRTAIKKPANSYIRRSNCDDKPYIELKIWHENGSHLIKMMHGIEERKVCLNDFIIFGRPYRRVRRVVEKR